MLAKDPAVLKLLLEAGADVYAVTSTRSTPLHVAAAHNYTASVICLLIKVGVSVQAKNSYGYTAAQIAKLKGNHLNESLLSRAAQYYKYLLS
jgi:uncharacterized protein